MKKIDGSGAGAAEKWHSSATLAGRNHHFLVLHRNIHLRLTNMQSVFYQYRGMVKFKFIFLQKSKTNPQQSLLATNHYP